MVCFFKINASVHTYVKKLLTLSKEKRKKKKVIFSNFFLAAHTADHGRNDICQTERREHVLRAALSPEKCHRAK